LLLLLLLGPQVQLTLLVLLHPKYLQVLPYPAHLVDLYLLYPLYLLLDLSILSLLSDKYTLLYILLHTYVISLRCF